MIRQAIRLMIGALLTLSVAAAGSAPAQAASAAPEVRQILVLTRLAPAHFQFNSAYGGSYGSSQARRAHRRLAEGIARHNGLTLADTWPLPLIGLDCFVMAIPDGRSIEEAVRQVSQNPDVVFVEPMQLYAAKEKPLSYNDPMYPAQPAAHLWHLAALHRISTGRGVRVAVIDSGIESSHPDLAGQLVANMNFVAGRPLAAERHGTGIAGVIAAKANNGLGIVGVAPDSRLLGLRACWQRSGPGPETICDTLSLAKALHFAIEHGAQVVNLSLAGPRTELLDRLLDIALTRRIDVIAAIDPALPGGGFPASHHGVIAVDDEMLARPVAGVYTAPGRDVITTQPGGRWNIVDGSSYAAAHVSGLFALVRARKSSADTSMILVAARSDGGMINACATLVRVTGPCNCDCPLTNQAVVAVHR